MPAMILADGMLGQMMEPVEFKENISLELPNKSWAANGHKNKRKHNVISSLYLTPQKLENLTLERYKKYEKIKESEQLAEEYLLDDADIILVSYGASSRISKSAVDMARKQGIKAGVIRPITLWPFPIKFIQKYINQANKFLCVEMSMGQMVDDVRLAVNGLKPVYFYGRTGGIIPTPNEVLNEIKRLASGGNE